MAGSVSFNLQGGDIEFDLWDVDGINSFTSEFENKASADVYEILMEYGPELIFYAQVNTPVKTGLLISSYDYEVVGGSGEDDPCILSIINNVFYFMYQEYGTRF